MFCTTECWDCEDRNCEHYISKSKLYFENQQLKDRIDKAIIYIATQKTKLYKKRNKPGLFNLINIEKMLLGKVKE